MKLLALRILTAAIIGGLLLGGMAAPRTAQAADPVTIEVMETIHVTDSPQVLPPAVIEISETVKVTDSPQILPEVALEVSETIHVTDSPQVVPPAEIEVVETIHVADSPQVLPAAAIEVTETVIVTDSPQIVPGRLDIESATRVPDDAGDFILINGDLNSPDNPCSLPPEAPLQLAPFMDIKNARITQLSGGWVELSLALQEPVPAAPTYQIVAYNWQFGDGSVGDGYVIVWWNRDAGSWQGKLGVITSLEPRQVELRGDVEFRFLDNTVRARVRLEDIRQMVPPGQPLTWFANVRRMPFVHDTFTHTLPVDFAPNIFILNLAPPPPLIRGADLALWLPDIDGDGISGNVDVNPSNASVEFSDGTTSGRVQSLSNGVAIGIMDASDPARGIEVVVWGPEGGTATIALDGSSGGTLTLPPGEYAFTTDPFRLQASIEEMLASSSATLKPASSEGTFILSKPVATAEAPFVISLGSVTLEVQENGRAQVEYVIGGTPVVVVMEAGETVKFDESIVNGQLGYVNITVLHGNVTINGVVLSAGQSLKIISAKSLKSGAIDKLNSAKTGDKKVDGTIDQANRLINNSLEEKLWLDPSHLVYGPTSDWLHGLVDRFDKDKKTVDDEDIDDDSRIGRQSPPGAKNGITVFHLEMSAIMTLDANRGNDKDRNDKDNKNKPSTSFDDVISDLVNADMVLAKVAISDAKGKTVINPAMSKIVINEIEAAESEFSRAMEAATKGQPAMAVTRFSHAWLHAQLAMKFAAMELPQPPPKIEPKDNGDKDKDKKK
jgi:hypothetical protein